jgi:MYXO-CTERM domain-containing protein
MFFTLTLLAACAALVLPGPRAARATAILVVSSGERDELQAAVDQAAALTEPAVILVPPGSWELFGTVTVGVDNLTILGAGPTRTLLYRDHEDAAPFIRIQGTVGVRVSGIGLRGSAAPASATLEVGIRVGDSIDFRIDHCRLGFLGNSGVMTQGDTRGVIDHSSFHDIFKDAIANYGYGVSIYGVGLMEDEPFGSARATFIEDSVLEGCRHATASNNGARYVLRHSLVNANEYSHAIDAHGDEYNSTDAGTEWIDIYDVLVQNPVYTTNAVRIRGGKGLIWSNTVNGYTYAVSLTENTPQETGPVYVWGNTLGSGTTLLNVGAGAEAVTSAPAGYVPYRYPHPLVDDLVAAAGPDGRFSTAPGAGLGVVFLDARASSAAQGTVVATRWFDGDQHLSDCAVDLVSLGPGQHLILLEVERTDGLLEHDLSVIDVIDSGGTSSLVSTSSWANVWFVPLWGPGVLELEVTPAASPMDGYVAVTGRWPVGAHEDNAAILRMNSLGFFDARDGAAYSSDQAIPYQAGQTYQVRFELDLPSQTYDVAIDGALLGSGYAFRLAAPELGQLTAWHSTGGVTATGFTLSGDLAVPDPPCAPEPPDAGLPDGGADAATQGPDSATTSDASTQGPDSGGNHPGASESGCGCAAGKGGAPPAEPLVVLVLIVLFGHPSRRLRRRHLAR